MKTLRLVLGDQLTPAMSSLEDISPGDIVLMAEVRAECRYVKHHAKKLVLVLSAMRHFAASLREAGIVVDYIRLDDPANTQALRDEFLRAVVRHRPARAVVTEAGEWRLAQDMAGWAERAGIAVDIRADTRFLCSVAEFRAWAGGRKSLRMEFFYRDMRRRHGYLMDGENPAGGAWNYDADNRNALPAGMAVPLVPHFVPDDITREVMQLVREHFLDHVGSVDDFSFPVTQEHARLALDDFLDDRLARFGDYQDAMKSGAPFLFHALIAQNLNLGLLTAREVCDAAEDKYYLGLAPLNAVEGFIRQILGWREYVRGIYWLNMPDYAQKNYFQAKRDLPAFYWTGETSMNCLHQTVTDTMKNAYAHHIQRLMITGNFALLAGIDPDQVDDWYLSVYADAYEWVEMPNTRGMALYADGGIMASKPYAASGAYINRMSDYCKSCVYDVKDATGARACPFNFLYWDFIARHREKLAGNQRMSMMLSSLSRMPADRLAVMQGKAAAFFGV